jgi:xanthine dehydrogenase accessory factor
VDERLFARLAALLAHEPVVLASVQEARGATPRKRGSRMLITRSADEFSVGGGAMESRVLSAARALLDCGEHEAELEIDLSGREGAAGVCGGRMRVALRRWQGEDDRLYAADIAAQLAEGRPVWAGAEEFGASVEGELLAPDPRLLIAGGGHCGLALYELARSLDFDVFVFDQRAECFARGQFAQATRRDGEYSALEGAFADQREVYAVLLNRDFPSDVATLRALVARPLAFLGMMGSRKRIAEVRAALPEHAEWLALKLRAPVGLDIGAHTPQEIAVSILAQLIQVRQLRLAADA